LTGKVFLVGAGPGDPSLLTLRAAKLLATADVIAVDALVSPEIKALMNRDARIVNVGKRASAHTLPQDQINQLLVDEAKKGLRVVRLKGGDPFVFGRGAEEAEELVEADVPFEIVPGISSAIAGPAYAGIPVTHRSFATSVTLVTGHESDESTGVNWPFLARSNGTIVFLMGFANIGTIARKLIEHGMASTTPIGVISKATTPRQRTVTGTLESIEAIVAGAQLETPALIVVGGVVSLHDKIAWFETRPLFGRSVVVTRAREQASELKRLLEEAGANVLQFPTIEIAAPDSWDSLDAIIDRLATYQWVIFTSTNGVQAFFERLFAKGLDVRALANTKVAAVGDTTAAELRARGLNPDLVPGKFQSVALLPHLAADQAGIRTAVIRAAEGRDELIDELRRRGGQVDLGIAYQTRATADRLDDLRQLIAAGGIDVVTFTSSSTVDHFFEKLNDEERAKVHTTVKLASIGPVTSESIRKWGGEVAIEARSAGVEALFEAVVNLF
jgi:uroporphyrinogen III methyltransferase/synthase